MSSVLTPDRIENDVGTGGTLTHYEDHDNEGFTFCGIRITSRVTGGADCVVCISEHQRKNARRKWWEKWVSRRANRD